MRWPIEGCCRCLLGYAALAAALVGCAPLGSFTTARTLRPGEVAHAVSLEVNGSQFRRTLDPAWAQKRGRSRSDTNSIGGHPAYSLRVGVIPRLELGGKLSPFAIDLFGKVGIYQAERLQLAIAPHVTTGGKLPFVPPYFFRLPMLLTLEPSRHFAFTPRFGAGYAHDFHLGRHSTLLDINNPVQLSTPVLEAGLTFSVRLSSRFALASEAYGMLALRDQQLRSLGFGVALVYGPPRP